jgi:O-antigen/teichoic acid export membrane protein
MPRAAADPFWRSVGVVLAGTVSAQSIPILGSLILARLFIPTEFGIFSAWLGLTALAAVMITGRFEMALAIEPDGSPRRLAVAATLTTIAIGCVLLTVLALIARHLGFGSGTTALMQAAFVPAAALTATSQTWQSWAAAEGRFRSLSLIRITQAASITAMQIGAGWIWHSATALAAAQVAGLALSLVVAVWLLPLNTGMATSSPEFFAAVRGFWRRQNRFLLFSLPSDAINTAAAQLPLLLVTSRFGAEIGGWLALTQRTLGAPIALLGASVLDVFRRRSAASFRERGECRHEYVRTFKVLSAGSIAASIVLILGGESLFGIAFGQQWKFSGTIAQWMTPMFALRFVASPLSYLFYVCGKQNIDLLWQIALLTCTVATLASVSSFRGALTAYIGAYSALYVIYLVITYRLSRGTPR